MFIFNLSTQLDQLNQEYPTLFTIAQIIGYLLIVYLVGSSINAAIIRRQAHMHNLDQETLQTKLRQNHRTWYIIASSIIGGLVLISFCIALFK